MYHSSPTVWPRRPSRQSNEIGFSSHVLRDVMRQASLEPVGAGPRPTRSARRQWCDVRGTCLALGLPHRRRGAGQVLAALCLPRWPCLQSGRRSSQVRRFVATRYDRPVASRRDEPSDTHGTGQPCPRPERARRGTTLRFADGSATVAARAVRRRILGQPHHRCGCPVQGSPQRDQAMRLSYPRNGLGGAGRAILHKPSVAI